MLAAPTDRVIRRCPSPFSMPMEVKAMRLDSGHPQVGMSEHVHTFHELILVTEGGGEHVYATRRHPFAAGQLWAIAPGVSHAIPDPCQARGQIVVFEARALFGSTTPLLHRHAHPLLRAFAAPQPLMLEPEVCVRLGGRMAELQDELSQRRQRWSAAALALLRLVLIDASRQTPDDLAGDHGVSPAAWRAANRYRIDAATTSVRSLPAA